jgi:electron transfer flavoprotein beta subunit
MRFMVLVKQVPETDSVQVDPGTGTLKREGVPSILNPFCEYALDEAVRLRSNLQEDVEIVALTMGPPQASHALMRCLELGADRGILLCDRAFAGSDCWATALTIAGCIGRMDVDLILAGRQAIDGDTAQVPVEIAEMLGLPQITGYHDIEMTDGTIVATRDTDSEKERVRVRIPALVSVGRGSNIRRIPSMRDFLDARQKELVVVGADDLDLDPVRTGLHGSMTQVTRVFPPIIREGGRRIDGSDPDRAAEVLLGFLEGRGLELRRDE